MVAIEREAQTLSELKVEEMEARTFIYKLIPEIINDIVEREVQKTNITAPEMDDFSSSSSSSSTFSNGSDISNISVDKVTIGTQTENGPMYFIRSHIENVWQWFNCFWNFPRYLF